MNVKEFREMDEGKLNETLKEYRKELFNLRFQHSTAQLDNTQRLPELKKAIARLMTVQKERELGVK